MKQSIAHIALVVNDYDEAIEFYTQKLNFILIEDTPQSETKRWVLVAPPGSNECSLLLAKGVGDEQRSCIGNQTGGRVFLFLRTDDFWRDYENMKAKEIICVAPEARKAEAVRRCFEGEIGPMAPASILRTHSAATIYLDKESAGLLRPSTIAAFAAAG